MYQIKAFIYFIKTIYQQRYVIRQLVRRDFQKKYLGSLLGLPWAFIQPTAIVMVMWVVFSVGLRTGSPHGNIPFLPWFIAGMIPWFYINECINTSSVSLASYSFLIKQMYFRVGVIPLIPIATATIIHTFLLGVLMIIVSIYGFYPSIYWLQLPYYLAGTVLLMIGLGWLLSALVIFVNDLKNIIGILITLFFWLTPIIWHHSMLHGKYRLLADLNPFFYITNGYREALLSHEWFFENITLTLYFWAFVAFTFVFGALVFHRLKPHFADVL